MISQDSINETLDKSDIVDVISEFVVMKKKGSLYVGSCPFHTEKTGSFTVTPSKQIFKCFGCGEGGDVFTFLMRKEHYTYPDAVRFVAKKYDVKLVEENSKEDAQVTERKALMYELNAIVCRYFQDELRQKLENEPDHWATMEIHGRRNFSPDSIADFKLGYAPDGWQFLAKKLSNEQLVLAKDLGLIIDKEGKRFDRFRDRLIFPMIDQMGRITGFASRKSPTCDNDKNPKHMNSPESMVFDKGSTFYGINLADREIRKMQYAILVEGQSDVIQMHQADICNTIATSGTAFTKKHAAKLKRFCKVAYIMADGDEAGRKSMLETIDLLIEEDISPYVIPLPDKQDPDSFIRMQQELIELESLNS